MPEELHTIMARKLAEYIHAQRVGLDSEERNRIPHPTYTRAKKYIELDRAKVHGMVIALTYMLGSPLVMEKAEDFIQQTRKRLSDA